MNFILVISYLVVLCLITSCSAQSDNQVGGRPQETLTWCAVRIEEMRKCQTFSQAVERDKVFFGADYFKLGCIQGFNKEDCMNLIENEKAQITTVDPGEVFAAGRYHSLVPILQELYAGNLRSYYAVAVIKKGTLTDITNLRHLKGKKACFPGVGVLAGWILPIDKLMREGGMDIIDCNNHVKTVISYFGPSCAVNSLHDKYNPIGDNSDKLCSLCNGTVGEKCTNSDPYAGYTGGFRCLLEAGEIAFLKHNTVLDLTNNRAEFPSVTKENFELLCLDGSRRSVEDYASCNWGSVPSHAVIASSAKSSKTRRAYQKFLQKAVQHYGGTEVNRTHDSNQGNRFNRYNEKSSNDNYNNRYNNPYSQFTTSTTTDEPGILYETFNLFESIPRYGNHYNLLFEDNAEQLIAIEEAKQTYTSFLGESLNTVLDIRRCPVKSMTLCVTSDPEMDKCIKMRTALKAQLLKPEMVCYKGHSHIHCMQAIKNGDADVAVFDAGDIYTGGLIYGLIPFLAEMYNLGVPEYYVVAVAKEDDPDTELTYLKGKNTCHAGVNTAAGWIVPLAFLLSNGWMRSYGCDGMRAAAEYFSKSCAPGALSTVYNTGPPYENMCHLCHGASFRYCRRDASEDYYGHTGAFRCLVEGGGDVAFVKHTTVLENADGKRREWWARNALNDDFQLLCPDGTRSVMKNFRNCNIGKAKANAVVTRGGDGYNEEEINAYINLFIYAQQFYGRKDHDYFNFAMFYSPPPYSDLIFQDSATKLEMIKPSQREYSAYLGKDFMRAKRIVDCFAGSHPFASPSYLLLLSLSLLVSASSIS